MRIYQLLTAMAVTLFMSCAGEKKETATEPQAEEKPRVKIEQVGQQEVEQLNEFTATVSANTVNRIGPNTPFRIEKIYAEVGDRVKAGQLLVKMNDTNLTQAKVQLDNKEVEFNRIDELYKVGGTSKSSWDAQKMALDVARASYEDLLENTQLRSPITGIITARNYDSGDMYTATQPIYVVEEIRPVKLLIHVSESFYVKVKKGNEVDIKLDVFGDQVFKGKINLIHPTIDPNTRTFAVEIKIDNADERVRPGMFARVTISFGTEQHVVAPDKAIVKQAGAGDRYIYVYKNGQVSYQKVELGRRMGSMYEIISGIEDGDQVVITGQSRLNNGMEVEIEK